MSIVFIEQLFALIYMYTSVDIFNVKKPASEGKKTIFFKCNKMP